MFCLSESSVLTVKINFAVKKGFIEQLQHQQGSRTGKYKYSFIPRSSRLLQSFEIHLVKILNKLPENFTVNYNKSIMKENIHNLDIENIITGLH